jgi:hypothetical protein
MKSSRDENFQHDLFYAVFTSYLIDRDNIDSARISPASGEASADSPTSIVVE